MSRQRGVEFNADEPIATQILSQRDSFDYSVLGDLAAVADYGPLDLALSDAGVAS